jgi:hypothetical protein
MVQLEQELEREQEREQEQELERARQIQCLRVVLVFRLR